MIPVPGTITDPNMEKVWNTKHPDYIEHRDLGDEHPERAEQVLDRYAPLLGGR